MPVQRVNVPNGKYRTAIDPAHQVLNLELVTQLVPYTAPGNMKRIRCQRCEGMLGEAGVGVDATGVLRIFDRWMLPIQRRKGSTPPGRPRPSVERSVITSKS